MSIRVAIPDLISPSYLPAIAAVELGLLPGKLELVYPVTKTYEELREGRIDFVGGAAHAALYAFKDWHGARLLCALAQHMYWFLVVRKDLGARRGDLSVLKGLRIGAAPGPADGLKQLLKRERVDGVSIAPVPGATGEKPSFGLLAARALAEGKLDGFWANGMGAEVAVRDGSGMILLDARRDGSQDIRGYTFPALVCTEKTVRERPELARAAIRALRQAQQSLRADPACATEIGRRLFPPQEASLIAGLVRRDAPYYDPVIAPAAVESMQHFARELGLLSRLVAYEDVVWNG